MPKGNFGILQRMPIVRVYSTRLFKSNDIFIIS